MILPASHHHVWRFVFNAHGGWIWRCHCGAYCNQDGRIGTGVGS